MALFDGTTTDSNLTFAQLSPDQQLNYLASQSFGRVGESISNLFGVPTQRSTMQNMLQQADMSTPQGLRALAQQLNAAGQSRDALTLMQKAQDMEVNAARIKTEQLRQKQTQAELNKPEVINIPRIVNQPDPIDPTKTKQVQMYTPAVRYQGKLYEYEDFKKRFPNEAMQVETQVVEQQAKGEQTPQPSSVQEQAAAALKKRQEAQQQTKQGGGTNLPKLPFTPTNNISQFTDAYMNAANSKEENDILNRQIPTGLIPREQIVAIVRKKQMRKQASQAPNMQPAVTGQTFLNVAP